MQLQIGFERVGTVAVPITIPIVNGCCHCLICGSSGSGKSVACLYWLNSIIEDVELYICDFKASGDFFDITANYAEGKACLSLLERFYEDFQTIKEERKPRKILLLFDEYAAFCAYLEGSDKAALKRVHTQISEMLMLGRALPGGGSAWLWMAQQRPDADYYPKGSRLNFHFRICMSAVTTETKHMLGIEEVPDNYVPSCGVGLLVRDGQPLQQFVVPHVDKEKLRKLLQKKAASRSRAKPDDAAAPT